MVNNQIIIYQTPDGQTAIDVKLENESLWHRQHLMAKLFGKDTNTIGFIENIYHDGK